MKSEFLGIAFDEYTPAVQARINRDILAVNNLCETRGTKLVVVCATDEPLFILNPLGVLMLNDTSLAKAWIAYEVEEKPKLPDNADQVISVSVPKNVRPEDKLNTQPVSNPYIPREQGQDATHISLIDRPSPNPYAPTSPAGVSVLFGM